ncbi:MAG: hypothetical protein J07AB43_12730 [Candidatus Nanosalina sp. J07AB43]|nr:MAG: hypothetical protein J07AB43_12730 [Candidatus Nanosalina sp. J07AB43]
MYRLETLTQIISSIFELKDDVSTDEKERYREMLNETLQYTEKSLADS